MRGKGPVLHSCRMQLPRGARESICSGRDMAATFEKLCCYRYPDCPAEKLAWFCWTHSTLEMRNPPPLSFHSSSFSSACLPFAIMWEVFLGCPLPPWRSNTGFAAEFRNLWWGPASSSLSFHSQLAQQELHLDYLLCPLASVILWIRNIAKGKQSENWFHCSLLGGKVFVALRSGIKTYKPYTCNCCVKSCYCP